MDIKHLLNPEHNEHKKENIKEDILFIINKVKNNSVENSLNNDNHVSDINIESDNINTNKFVTHNIRYRLHEAKKIMLEFDKTYMEYDVNKLFNDNIIKVKQIHSPVLPHLNNKQYKNIICKIKKNIKNFVNFFNFSKEDEDEIILKCDIMLMLINPKNIIGYSLFKTSVTIPYIIINHKFTYISIEKIFNVDYDMIPHLKSFSNSLFRNKDRGEIVKEIYFIDKINYKHEIFIENIIKIFCSKYKYKCEIMNKAISYIKFIYNKTFVNSNPFSLCASFIYYSSRDDEVDISELELINTFKINILSFRITYSKFVNLIINN